MTPQTDLRDEMDADDALLRAARHAHAASLDHLSPRVQAQLAQRRSAAMKPRRSAARGWPMVATASAAVLALAVGVFVLRDDVLGDDAPRNDALTQSTQATPSPDAAPTQVDTTMPAPALATGPASTTDISAPDTAAQASEATQVDADLPDTLLAAAFDDVGTRDYDAFEESPDFYAWLGSDDALADVPESL